MRMARLAKISSMKSLRDHGVVETTRATGAKCFLADASKRYATTNQEDRESGLHSSSQKGKDSVRTNNWCRLQQLQASLDQVYACRCISRRDATTCSVVNDGPTGPFACGVP